MPRNPVADALSPLTRLAAIACGWWLLLVAGLTCVEIVGRKLFGTSLQGVDEIGGYTLAAPASLSFAQALLSRAHTRIDFLIARLGTCARAWLNALAMLSLTCLALFATWRGADVLMESIEFGSRSTTPLQTPLWIPQSLWLMGLALLAFTASTLALHAARLLRVDRERLNLLYGPPTLEEEIERETGGVGALETVR